LLKKIARGNNGLSLKFAANLSFLYQEVPFLDRFDAAAQDGFSGVEYLFPYDFDPAEIKKRLDDNGLTQALFNLSAGNFEKGERGLASQTGRDAEFQASLDQAIEYANALGCTRLHVMAGLRDTTITENTQLALYRNNLQKAAAACEQSGITALIEPINTKIPKASAGSWPSLTLPSKRATVFPTMISSNTNKVAMKA
jgi:hydroxypyruvate isomerase